jgi:DNA-binding response OmpR family regulator
MILFASDLPANDVASNAFKLNLNACHFPFETVEEVGDVASFVEDFEGVDLVVIDGRGSEVCETIRLLRARSFTVPVLVIYCDGAISPTEVLAAGADDAWFTNPLVTAELEQRLHALIRRGQGVADPVLTVGPLCLNPAARTFEIDGRRVRLSNRAFEIMTLLMRRPGTTVSKSAIYDATYAMSDEPPDPKVIDVYICKLRAVLKEHGHPGLIGTTWGSGYFITDEPSETGSWFDGIGSAKKLFETLLKTLGDNPNGMEPNELIKAMGCDTEQGRATIYRAKRAGLLTNVGRRAAGEAFYQITPEGRERLRTLQEQKDAA